MDAVADAPQRRASWFAPFLPAAAAVGAAAVIATVALLINQNPNIGPSPVPSPVHTSSMAPSPSASPEPLSVPDGSIEFAATDRERGYGRISVRRGSDTAGYASSPVNQADSFFIELFMNYSLMRLPEPAEWGRNNWSVRAEDSTGGLLGGVVLAPENLGPEAPRPIITSWPGATEPELQNYEGWLLIQVPRTVADASVYLEYIPTGATEPQASYLVRSPGAAPPEIALPSPTLPPAYVSQDGNELTVIENAEADRLFDTPDTCTNPEGGYTITYPDDWYTNTATGDVQPCSWFSPRFNEVDDPARTPDEIAIVLNSFRGGVGFFYEPNYVLSESVTVAGYGGTRTEEAGGYWGDETLETGDRTYEYLIFIADGQDVDDRWIRGRTMNEMGGDYVLNKAVFDRIMANIVISNPER